MKEIEVDKINFHSNETRVDVTTFGSSTSQFVTTRERSLEVTISEDYKINRKLDILQSGEKVLIVGSNQCILLEKYQLGDYTFHASIDGFDDGTTINIIVEEEPIMAKDKDELIKDMI